MLPVTAMGKDQDGQRMVKPPRAQRLRKRLNCPYRVN
jgi:hypothetical protein